VSTVVDAIRRGGTANTDEGPIVPSQWSPVLARISAASPALSRLATTHRSPASESEYDAIEYSGLPVAHVVLDIMLCRSIFRRNAITVLAHKIFAQCRSEDLSEQTVGPPPRRPVNFSAAIPGASASQGRFDVGPSVVHGFNGTAPPPGD